MDHKNIISASITGGIGDIIFGLEGFRELKSSMKKPVETKCYVSTHCSDGISLIKANPYVDTISKTSFEYDLSHAKILIRKIQIDKNYYGEARNFCWTINPKIILPPDTNNVFNRIKHSNKRTLIMIHPIGSKFSQHFLKNIRNVSTKELSPEIWKHIVNEIWRLLPSPRILITGSKLDRAEIDAFNIDPGKARNIAGQFSLLENIAIIQAANYVIGVDSFAKSVSLASKIPTTVFINDHDDPFRDTTFLDPYIGEKYANIIRNANTLNIDTIIKKIHKMII